MAVVFHHLDTATWCVHIEGDIDLANARMVEAELALALDSGAGRIDVDLAKATFWDGTALRTLVRAGDRAGILGIEFVLVAPQPPLRRLLDLTALADRFVIED